MALAPGTPAPDVDFEYAHPAVSTRCNYPHTLPSQHSIDSRAGCVGISELRRRCVFCFRVRLVDSRARLASRGSRRTRRQRTRSTRAEWTWLGGDRRRASVGHDVTPVSTVVAGRNLRDVQRKTSNAQGHSPRACGCVGRRRSATSAYELSSAVAGSLWPLSPADFRGVQ